MCAGVENLLVGRNLAAGVAAGGEMQEFTCSMLSE